MDSQHSTTAHIETGAFFGQSQHMVLSTGFVQNDINEAIRQLFDLSKEYVLLADMDCVHRRKGKLTNTHGHLYIFNLCLGFHAKGMKSIVLPFKRIKNIKKSNSLKDRLKGKIKVTLDDNQQIAFKRIKHRDSTFETLYKLWQEQITGVSSGPGMVPAGNLSTISQADPSPPISESMIKDMKASALEEETKVASESDSGDEEEEGKCDNDNSQSIPCTDGDVDPNLRDPTDEELMRELGKIPMPPNHREIGKMILPFSVEEYYNLFHAIGSPYNFDRYFTYRGYRNIVITQDWTESIDDPVLKNGWGKPSMKWKQISYDVDVKGNPFVKVSPTTKNYILMEHQRHYLMMRLWTQFRNIPYADAFNPEEQYIVVSLPRQPIDPSQPYIQDAPSRKVAFRICSTIIFHKSVSLFKSKIEKGSIEKGVESFQVWTGWASTKIEEYRELNPLPKPLPLKPKEPSYKKKQTESAQRASSQVQQESNQASPVQLQQPQVVQQVVEVTKKEFDDLQKKVKTLENEISAMKTNQELIQNEYQNKFKIIIGIVVVLFIATIFF